MTTKHQTRERLSSPKGYVEAAAQAWTAPNDVRTTAGLQQQRRLRGLTPRLYDTFAESGRRDTEREEGVAKVTT